MANRKITFTNDQIKAIKAALKKNKNKNTDRRLRVLLMKSEGKRTEEIAVRTGFSYNYSRSLITKYFALGLESIIGKKRMGNHRNMPLEDEIAFLNSFIERSEKGELVTVKEIKLAYEAKVGHKIGSGHIYIILNRHEWHKIKPRPQHPKKASKAEIEASKKLTPEHSI